MAAVLNEKSTIVRALRAAFKVLPPAGGSWLAERLWCTIPRGRVRPFTRPGERLTVSVDGRTVVAEMWGAGPIVYLMHGWGGWRGQFDAFVEPLVATGHRVVALDAPSHGDSAPGAFGRGRALLQEFSTALAAVVAAVGPAHAIVGHSLGGTATALAALDGLPAERLVLIAPMGEPVQFSHGFARLFGLDERVHAGFLRRLEARVGRPMSDFDPVARAGSAAEAVARSAMGMNELPKLLVIHDRDDKEIPHTDGVSIAEAWPDGALKLTDGLGHRRILRDAGVISHVVGYLAATRVPSPPSNPLEVVGGRH